MKVPAKNILKQFVDRAREFMGFEKMLGSPDICIMCFYGPGGIGKSLLVSRMINECENRGLRWVYIEWEDSRRYNYMDVMRKIRDDTEPSLFELFNDRVNFYTVPEYNLKIPIEGGAIENVEVLSGGEIKQSGVSVHLGHKVEIKDLMINIQRPDRDVTEDEIIIGCTHTFMPCLKAVIGDKPLIIFLDALEKADERTLHWIKNELLKRVRDEEIPNLFIALSGRKPFELDPSFFEISDEYELQPFQANDILEYLVKRGFEEEDNKLADFIHYTFKGNPKEIATSVDSFIRFQRKK